MTLYRSMLPDVTAPTLPRVGTLADHLGARVPTDIEPDDGGDVHPRTGGMSTFTTVEAIPPHRKPRGFRGGSNNKGIGVFQIDSAKIDATLAIRGAGLHVCVEPAVKMALANYQTKLASTQQQWHKVA